MRRRTQSIPEQGSREQVLLRRARRHERRGQGRKAIVAAREACFLAATDARLWAVYASYCWKAGRMPEACDALRQAIWYRERSRDRARASVLKGLLSKLERGLVPNAA